MKTVKKMKNNVGQSPDSLVKLSAIRRNAGSCTGVKYPCSYHCKKCIFDTIYCK